LADNISKLDATLKQNLICQNLNLFLTRETEQLFWVSLKSYWN